MYRSCKKCPVDQSVCRCYYNEFQNSFYDIYPGEPYNGQCSCCPCEKPMVKGTFGLAYVIETPEKKFCKPLGWQVEFEDTPSKIANNCQKMMKWVNCPPLGDCNNIETNFCAYPEDCGQLLKEQRNRPPKCCCISKSIKKDKTCPREPKKKCKNQICCNQNPEPVCIICDNCKVNTPRCCNPPKVLCCSKNSRKPLCKCQDRNDARCKCCTKEDELEKCCKCCRPNLNTFFRESLDKKYCDEYEHDHCCCAKKFCICDDLLDYIPNKDTERNRSSEENTCPKTVSKENKETKTDDRETSKKEPMEVQAKPAQSTKSLQERKEKGVVAPKNKHEESNRKNITEVPEKKNVTSKATSKKKISESQYKNEENVRKNTNETATEKNKLQEKGISKAPLQRVTPVGQSRSIKNEENIRNETKIIPKTPSKVDEKYQVKTPANKNIGSKSVKTRNISSRPSILQKIKEAHKRQLNEIHPGKSTDNRSNLSELKPEEEIKKIDYDVTSKSVIEKIKQTPASTS